MKKSTKYTNYRNEYSISFQTFDWMVELLWPRRTMWWFQSISVCSLAWCQQWVQQTQLCVNWTLKQYRGHQQHGLASHTSRRAAINPMEGVSISCVRRTKDDYIQFLLNMDYYQTVHVSTSPHSFLLNHM